MLCKSPFVKQPVGISQKMRVLSEDARTAGMPFPCGQCLPCRINRARVWQHRLILESLTCDYSVFITLTYNEDSVPKGGTLVPGDATKFLKRLRYYIPDVKIRYFLVGEYGDQSSRPHYHAALFNVAMSDEEAIGDAWKMGFIQVGELNEKSARYLCGYVTKGMTKKFVKGLNDREPEFMRCSKGLGGEAVEMVASNMKWRPDTTVRTLKHGKKEFPLGRYLTERLATRIGEKRLMYDEVYAHYDDLFQNTLYMAKLKEEMEPNIRKVEGRHRRFRKGRVL